MDHWIWFVITCATALGCYFWGVHDGKTENPYRWKCMHEGCKFHASSTNMEFLMIVAETHEKSHG